MTEHVNHVEPGLWSTRILSWTDRHRRVLFVVLFVFYAAGFNGQWRVGPDSAAFATIARNVAEGRGFEHPTGFEGHASPGLIYLLATSFRLAGEDAFWPMLVLIFAMAMATLALVYRTLLLNLGRPTAVVVTLMVGESSLFFRFTFDVLNTIPFLFGVMFLLWSHERQQQRLGSPATNYAIMILSFAWMAAFRIVFLNVLAAWLLVMFIQAMRSPRRWRILGLIGTVLLVLILLRFVIDPRARDGQLLPREQEILYRLSTLPQTLTTNLPANAALLLTEEGTDAIVGNTLGLGVINAAVTLTAIGAMIALGRRRLLWGVLPALFVIQWLLFLPDARYFTAVLPLLALGWWRLWTGVEHRWRTRWAGVVMLVMTGLWPIMNVPRSAGFLIEQRRVPFHDHYDRGAIGGLRPFSAAIAEKTEQDCWIIGSLHNASPIGYWSRRRVFPPYTHLIPADLTGPGYIVTPLDEQQQERLAELHRGWSVGPEILSVPGKPDHPPWRLHRLIVEPDRQDP